jgi:hypothetical protein
VKLLHAHESLSCHQKEISRNYRAKVIQGDDLHTKQQILMLGFPKLQGEMVLEESKPQNSQVKMLAATTEAMEVAPTALKSFVNKISEETSLC